MNKSRSRTPLLSACLLAGGALTLVACGGQQAFQGNIPLTVVGTLPAPPPSEPPKPAPRVEVRDNQIQINEKIQFEHAKANIMEESHSLLNEVVSVIKANPHIKKIAIEGHASSEGNVDFNRTLSDNRAKAVRQYLISQGIEEAALTAKGFGSDKPIATNDTEEGREKNRRVEFNIVEQDITQKRVEIDPTTGEERVIEQKPVVGRSKSN